MLAFESIYWVKMNGNIERSNRNFPICLDFQATLPKDKRMSHEYQGGHGNL